NFPCYPVFFEFREGRDRERQLCKAADCLESKDGERETWGGHRGERGGHQEGPCSVTESSRASSGKLYLLEKSRGEVIFGFPGSWSAGEWFSGDPFGEIKVNQQLFPSLKSIGTDEVATVNQAFLRRFEALLRTPSFEAEVKKAVTDNKEVVFTGHSSGGPVAILATLWFLECQRSIPCLTSPRCVTFGSPLVGNRIFSHALRRENWDRFFVHFVMRYDIVPRIMLAPLSSIKQEELQKILHFFNPKSAQFGHEAIARARETSNFFINVLRNVTTVASHAACNMKRCTNPLLETITSFIELSPYRPFGTYVFCTGNGKLVVAKNPDAVLQLLFYSSQLSGETECQNIATRSLKEHLVYNDELKESLEMQNVAYLDSHLQELPLSSNGTAHGEIATIHAALNDLGLSTSARLSLRAAGELEKQKQRNQEKINSHKKAIEERLVSIQKYRIDHAVRRLGYYDAFKQQNYAEDFKANVKRLELAGMWDEIIEMLKRYELPDEFEGRKDWIELGTRYRRLVEPLDIANYYRHLKHEDTGPYLIKARPKRYRFTQRWLEHAERVPSDSRSESCFWAEVEDLKSRGKSFEEQKEKILQLQNDVLGWDQSGEIGKDVFLMKSTFAIWWNSLPCAASLAEKFCDQLQEPSAL
ncbi:Carboxylesterase, partial [Bertholletia excelsa]